MFLTGYLRYLMRDMWTIQEMSPNHIVCSNQYDPNIQIEVMKIFFTNDLTGEIQYTVKVTIPLHQGSFSTQFPREMLAYEYLENFVFDFMEKGIHHPFEKPQFEKKFFQKGFETKRRRLSGWYIAQDAD